MSSYAMLWKISASPSLSISCNRVVAQDDDSVPAPSQTWILQECVLADELVLQYRSRQVLPECTVRLYLSPNKRLCSRITNRELGGISRWLNERDQQLSDAGDVVPDEQSPNASKECSDDPRDRIHAMIALMVPDRPKSIPDYGATDEAVFLDVVDKRVEWGPQRAGRIGYLATMLDLVPFDKPLEEWSAVVCSKLLEAHLLMQQAQR